MKAGLETAADQTCPLGFQVAGVARLTMRVTVPSPSWEMSTVVLFRECLEFCLWLGFSLVTVSVTAWLNSSQLGGKPTTSGCLQGEALV